MDRIRPDPFHRTKNNAAIIKLITDDKSGKHMQDLPVFPFFLRINDAAEIIVKKTAKLIKKGIFPFPAVNIKTGISEKKRLIWCLNFY